MEREPAPPATDSVSHRPSQPSIPYPPSRPARHGPICSRTSLPNFIQFKHERIALLSSSLYATMSERLSTPTLGVLNANSSRQCPSLPPPVMPKCVQKCSRASSSTNSPTHIEPVCTKPFAYLLAMSGESQTINGGCPTQSVVKPNDRRHYRHARPTHFLCLRRCK